MNFMVGIIALIFRIMIIGLVSILDRLLNRTISSITDTHTSLEDTGITAVNADDPNSENRKVTVESILFNQLDIFDINIFRTF